MGKILRRTFLVGSAIVAGSAALGVYAVRKSYANPLEGRTGPGEETLNRFLTIAADGTVTVHVPRSEMGQGVMTSLPVLVAEELDVELAAITVEPAPADHAYYNAAMLEDGAPLAHFNRSVTAELTRETAGVVGKFFGLQITGGSSSLKDAWVRMRTAGATARTALKMAAATREGVDISTLRTEAGHVVIGDRRIPYGDLVADAAKLEAPEVELRPASEWRLIGRSQPRTDMLAKVTGAPIFGIDVELPNMLHATVRMNPRLGGTLVSFDATEARKLPGVLDVFQLTTPDEDLGNGIAVVATNTWAAFRGADAVVCDWGEAPYPATTNAIMEVIAGSLGDGGDGLRDSGSVDTAFAAAPRERVLEAEYRVPYLAHTTMEPMNATAVVRDDSMEIWAGTQMPTLVRADCALETGLSEDAVEVHTTYLGGGFGRRGELDFTRYATRIANRLKGRPVKVTWSREEDTRHDTYRPAAVGRFRARFDENGPRAVDMKIACPSVMRSAFSRTFPRLPTAGPDNSITQGAFDQPYGIADYRVSGIKAPVDIPIGFWRSVGNSYNGFFHEGFMDEIAVAAKVDPITMRLGLMRDHPAAIGVVRRVADMSDWSAPRDPGTGLGFAFTLSFGCWTAQVAKVSVADERVTIEDVWCAADLGTVVDPAIVKAQLSSGIVFGLSSAMNQKITFSDGMVEQANFYDHDAMRIHQAPRIHVELLENAEHMGGAGEPGTPPSIPALVNAIYDASGRRVRSLPLTDSGFTFA